MIIDRPRDVDIPRLKSLWREAFGDEDEYIDGFFSVAYSPERARAVRLDGKIAAALYWFDCELYGTRVAYIYAVATFFAYRGRGLCSALMEDTHRHLRKSGYGGAVLVPVGPTLFGFYEKFGYRPFGGISAFSATAADKAASLTKISAEEYARLRRGMLPEGAIIEEGVCLPYLEMQADLYRGEGLLLAARREKDRLFGIELLGNTAAAPELLRALGCTEGSFRTVGTDLPFAMYLPLAEGVKMPAYFGLAFD